MNMLVIIVTYNGIQWIEKCITSILNSSVAADIFVVDNGSTDGTKEFIKKNYKQVILADNDFNLGFGQANNIGLRYAIKNKYDYVYLLNQDAWVSYKTFEYLITLLQKHPEYGIISPIQNNVSGYLDRNFAHICPQRLISDLFRKDVKDVYEVNEVMAAHWMISRRCIETVGAFSPSFPHYGEDNNYIQRAKYHNFKVGITTGNMVIHDREFRALSKSQIIYREHIKAITDFSDPFAKVSLLHIIFWQYIKKSITLKSIRPFRYLFKFVIGYKRLRRYKNESLKTGAFL